MRLRTLIAFAIFLTMIVVIGMPTLPDWTGRDSTGLTKKMKEELPLIGSAIRPSGSSDITVYFCAVDDCVRPLSAFINETNQSNTTLQCALYDVTIPGIVSMLQDLSSEGRAQLVVDDEATETDRRLDFAKRDHPSGLMHNKFCVRDATVLTGSFNPTAAGATSYD